MCVVWMALRIKRNLLLCIVVVPLEISSMNGAPHVHANRRERESKPESDKHVDIKRHNPSTLFLSFSVPANLKPYPVSPN